MNKSKAIVMQENEAQKQDLNAVLGLRNADTPTEAAANSGEGASSAANENLANSAASDRTNDGDERAAFDVLRFVFFVSLIATICFTSVSLVQPTGYFADKQIHLLTFGAGGLMILLWLVRGAGARLGLFPDRDAALKRELQQNWRVNWLDGLDEPAVLCDQNGLPVQANEAYKILADTQRIYVYDDENIMSVERLFSGNAENKPKIFQLAQDVIREGKAEQGVILHNSQGRSQQTEYIIKVVSISTQRTLWRLCPSSDKSKNQAHIGTTGLFAEDAPIGFISARADGTIREINPWLRKFLTVEGPVQGLDISDFLGLDGNQAFPYKRLKPLQTADLTLKNHSGREITVKAYTNSVGDGAHAQIQIYIIPQFIQRDSTVNAAVPNQADAHALINNAPFGALTLSGVDMANATIQGQNAAFSNLGVDIEVIEQPLHSLFMINLAAGEDSSKVEAQIIERLKEAAHKPVVFQLKGNGEPFVQVSVLLDEYGHPVLAYIFDLTEQRALEERLAQGEKMQAIGQLAGGIAHDFNNVLQGIVFNTDQLKMRHPIGDPSYENLKKIMEFVQRSKSLTRQLLAYAREQTFKHEIFNPTEFLTDFERLLRQTIDQRVKLNIQHGAAIPWIKADKNQIETAIINLAANARDAMLAKQNSGVLNIRTHRATGKDAHALGFSFVEEGEYLLIEVEDNGGGIAPENMQKIFNPFFTTKPVGVGTGLGLASVMGIIKQSGGFICPTSEMGQGTLFRIYLPALKDDNVPMELKNPPMRTAPSRPKDITGRGRILFVEDEDGVRGIGANLLRSRGYDVTEAEDGDEAFEILESEDMFDLIITDVVMPGRDGPTLINDAKDLIKDTQVVFISGYADQDLAKKLDAHKEVEFLPKPFSMRALAELVKDMLGAATSDRAA